MGKFESRQPRKRKGAAVWIIIVLVLLIGAAAARYFFLRQDAPQIEQAAPQLSAQEVEPVEPVQTPPPRTVVPKVELLKEPEPEVEPEAEPEPEPEVPESTSLTLMALGDNLIHWSVYTSAQTADGYDFTPFYEDISKIAAQYDLACINQETIFINDRQEISNYPVFGSPPEVGDALAAAGFDIVTCATNHAYDKREAGVYDTVSFWREKHPEITMLGLHDSEEDAQILHVVEKNGIRLALLNYTYSLNGFVASQPYFADMLTDKDKIRSDLARAEEEADLTIVFAHWGVEYQYLPDPSQTQMAQFMADNGADLIIGAHPHVVEPLWVVTAADGRQVPVFYSLGNFLSQQPNMINHLGAMASVEITKDETGTYVSSYEILPTVNVILKNPEGPLNSYRPMLLRDYTQELADLHVLGCMPDWMQMKFDEIVSLPDPNAPAQAN